MASGMRKGTFGHLHSVDQDQPLCDFENTYT